jgi:hypothetical protein
MILVELCAPVRTAGKEPTVNLSALNVITVSAYTITTELSAHVRTAGQGLPVINDLHRSHVVIVARVSVLSMVVEKATANVTHTTVEGRVNTIIYAHWQKPSANIEVYVNHPVIRTSSVQQVGLV